MTRPFINFLLSIIIPTGLAVFLHPLYLLILILPLILIIVDAIQATESYPTFITGIYCIGSKKVKSRRGKFILQLDPNKTTKMNLFQDRFFWLEHVDSGYFKDIETTKKWVKTHLDVIYHDHDEKDSVRSELSKWNGYIYQQEERDSKLNKIL
jgi:predicted PurR-regulated permease PerM